MEQISLGDFPKSEKLDQFSKAEIISKYSVLEEQYLRAIKEISRLKNQNLTDEQLNLILQEQLADFQNTLYGTSSERYKKPEEKKKKSYHQSRKSSNHQSAIQIFRFARN